MNDSLVKVVQSGREKRYSDAIESLNKLLPLMDKWFHAEPEVHRLYFRTYYRVLKACLYGDLGLYHWLNNDLLSASLALEQSIRILPTHLSLQRLSYLAIQHNDSNSATSHLLCASGQSGRRSHRFRRQRFADGTGCAVGRYYLLRAGLQRQSADAAPLCAQRKVSLL